MWCTLASLALESWLLAGLGLFLAVCFSCAAAMFAFTSSSKVDCIMSRDSWSYNCSYKMVDHTHEEEYITEHAQKITNNYIIHSTTQTVYKTK